MDELVVALSCESGISRSEVSRIWATIRPEQANLPAFYREKSPRSTGVQAMRALSGSPKQ